MKNNKGFTLVELMAVIAVIAIIIGIAVPSYINITKSTNQKMLDNKITEIKTKAEEYASSNNVDNTTITVETLIKEGYLEVDNVDTGSNEGEQITNPMGGYLDCYIVHINKNEGEYNISVDENSDCNVSVDDTYSSNISVYVYIYENNIVGDSLGSNNDVIWTNKDVLLYADLSALELTSNKVTWTVGTTDEERDKPITSVVDKNYNDYANEIVVSANLFLNTEYKVSVETSEGVITKKVLVKIDKERPYVNTSVNEQWTKGNKDVTMTGSDGTGSGIDKFYITQTTTTPIADDFNITSQNNQAIQSLEIGTYYAYVKDKVGNISDAKKVEITNVDDQAPIIMVLTDPLSLGTQDYDFKNNINVTWGTSGEGKITCEPPSSLKAGSYPVTCSATGNSGLSASSTFAVRHSYAATYVSKTCTQSRTCSGTRQVCSQSCHNEQDCGYCIGNNWCCPGTCGSCCSGYYCQSKTVCSNSCHNESYNYDCSYSYNCSYYSCPNGGSLSGTTCNY